MNNSEYSNNVKSPVTYGSPAKSNISDGPIDYSAWKKTELKTLKYVGDRDKEI